MASHRISVRRVLELDVPLTWQEAVAVVHEVAIQSVINDTRGTPSRIDADTCILTRRGDVELPQATDEARPDAALQLLRELLAGRETPPDLEALAYGAAGKNLSDDLAMFSRPNRRNEIAGLALRALQTEEEMARRGVTPPALVDGARPPAPAAESPAAATPEPPPAATPGPTPADHELAKLREQVAARPELAPPPAEAPALAARRDYRVHVRVGAAAVVVVALVSGWWRWSLSPPTPPQATSWLPPVSAPLGPIPLDPAWHTAGRRGADVELGARVASIPPSPTVGSGASANSPATVAAANAGLGGTVAAPAPTPAAAEVATTITGASDDAVEALFADTSVYSDRNEGVVPPLMLYPRMPRSAFPGPGDAVEGPVFEVLVDQQGGVEAVRLRGREQPGQSFYRARMMLSAAKAWQFRPARLDGRPVRYVVRVAPEP
jgi:hypothetical protein